MKVTSIITGSIISPASGILAAMDRFSTTPFVAIYREQGALVAELTIHWSFNSHSNEREGAIDITAHCLFQIEFENAEEKINVQSFLPEIQESVEHYNQTVEYASNINGFFLKREYLISQDNVSEHLPQIQANIDNLDTPENRVAPETL